MQNIPHYVDPESRTELNVSESYTCPENGFISVYANGDTGSISIMLKGYAIATAVRGGMTSPIPVKKGDILSFRVNVGSNHSAYFYKMR